ncbi:MAG: isoprenylcysteine carboxylmethyltransferase family protein [Flavobacteriaceae bacterium]
MTLYEEFNKQGDFLFRNRSFLPLIFLFAGLLVHVQGELNEDPSALEIGIEEFEFVCLGVALLGLLIRIFTVGYSQDRTSGRNTTQGQIADNLNTKGAYSLVRHPLYLGNFFMWLGVAMIPENVWFIIVFGLVFWLYYERIMFTEETFLRKKFGDDYLIWTSTTPAVIPDFRNYLHPTNSFNWRKVLRNEKNGFAAIFLLFWLFEFSGEIAEQDGDVIEFDFWFYAALTSLIIYFYLKIL